MVAHPAPVAAFIHVAYSFQDAKHREDVIESVLFHNNKVFAVYSSLYSFGEGRNLRL
jgi:hypothetical protein